MAKSKDFIYKDVMDAGGRRLGYVKDLILDFGKGQVLGFTVCPYKFMRKEFCILREQILYVKSCIVVNGIVQGEYYTLNSLLNMHVIDKKFNVIGLVSELIFDSETFEIKGVFIRGTAMFSLFKDRKVLLSKDLIIGEDYILYTGGCEWIEMLCLPSFKNNGREDLYYEKDTV